MASTGYRPRIYRSERLSLRTDGLRTEALRKDADESIVPLNEPAVRAVERVAMREKFEVEIDPQNPVPLKVVVERYIQRVLELKDGNKAKAALALGVGRTTIYRKLGLRQK